MTSLPQVLCGPCGVTSLVVPNVRFVGRPERGRVAVEVDRPCCNRTVVVFMDESWEPVLSAAQERRFDVEFDVAVFTTELTLAGVRAAALIAGEGTSDV